jgi:hypothetical protein
MRNGRGRLNEGERGRLGDWETGGRVIRIRNANS